jgi:hypothetical protein
MLVYVGKNKEGNIPNGGYIIFGYTPLNPNGNGPQR